MTTPPNGSPFAQPSAGGDKFEPKEWAGALLIVFPKSYNPNETTQFGPSTSADCDVVIVDRPGPDGRPTYKANARLFGNLANSVRDSIGSQVLGRLAQVPTNKGNPAWVLNSYSDMDVQAAMPALQAYQAGQFKAAQVSAPPSMNAQASAAQDPWAGVNAAPAPAHQDPWAQPSKLPSAQAQQQWAPPPPPAPTAAPPYGSAPAAAGGNSDPVSAFLGARGMNPDAVASMDPATRHAVASQMGYTG